MAYMNKSKKSNLKQARWLRDKVNAACADHYPHPDIGGTRWRVSLDEISNKLIKVTLVSYSETGGSNDAFSARDARDKVVSALSCESDDFPRVDGLGIGHGTVETGRIPSAISASYATAEWWLMVQPRGRA